MWQFMVLNVSASKPGTTATWDAGHSTATDINGNVYVAGYFNSSTITFGTISLTKTNSVTSSYNMFLVKYGPGGNLLWVTKAGGSGGNDQPNGIVTDGSGNVYVTGLCNTNITFYSFPSSGPTITLNNANSYLVKYDQYGNVVWAINEIGLPQWQGIAIAGEYLYCTGSFSGTITIGKTILTSAGSLDVFTAEYDLNGNVIWATSAGGSGLDMGIGIATDINGNAYITGFFDSPSMKFGTYTLINKGSSSIDDDIYFAKYDVYGNLQWATSASGSNSVESWSIASDATGDTYITGGSGSSSLTFYSAISSGKTITLNGTSGGPVGYYTVMYDSNGNAIWAKTGCSSGVGEGVATDQTGNVYATGQYINPTNFGSGTLKSKPVTNPVLDLFLVKYNSSGSFQWVQYAGGTSTLSQDAATDNTGNVLITGYFNASTITFGTITLTDGNSGDVDMFIAKYDANGNALWAKSAGAPPAGTISTPSLAGKNDPTANEITVYPNPTSGKVTVSTCNSQSAINSISVFNMIGKEVLNRQSAVGSQQVEIDLSLQPKGLYILEVKAGENFYQKKIIVE